MSVVPWRDEFSVKIPSIDRQHRTLVRHLSRLSEALAAGNDAALVGEILDGLLRYTAAHFSYEEMLFRVYRYPGDAAHRAAHGRLYGELAAYKARFDAGEQQMGAELLGFLQDWLQTHILEEDMAYSEFLLERGVS